MKLSILAPLAAVVGAGAMLWAGAATSQSTGAGQPTECDYTAYGRTVDGQSLWPQTQTGITVQERSDTNCLINQFAINNFLYLVGDDGAGHPRFMNMAPWYDMLPQYGAPAAWSGTYSPLKGVQLNNSDNQEQAGDGFELLDVNSQITAYDIRVNQPFYDYVGSHKLYTSVALNAKRLEFNANSQVGGIWLPPTDGDGSKPGSIEIKTAWRPYGAGSVGACPGDIMHCETDDSGNSWGLVGMHLVQKTTGHGEFIWASFEHVGNSPDCETGGTNPIGKNPVSPLGVSLNMNQNISSLRDTTGWNYFDYATYIVGGGNGDECSFPTQAGGQNAQCLTSPEGDKAGDWVKVNVCRTQPIPADADVCAGSLTDPTNLKTIACLNNSVANNFPSSLNAKWGNYQLIGMEWLFNGSTGDGAVTTGCFTYDENDAKDACPNYPGGSGELGVPHYARTGSTEMANTTMETWMQNQMYLETKFSGTVTAADCFACHKPQTRSYQGDMSHIFGRISQ